MKKLLLGFAVMAVAATGIATAGTSNMKDRRAKALAAYQPAGEPVSCITSSQIRSTNVIDDRTIDFKMAGGKVYRNTLTHSCPSLGFEERFSYRTSTNQLCSVDIIRVLQNYGGGLQEGAGCGLGKFQPIEKVSSQ
jgi:Family of unknown function (DUF6491)